MGRMRIMGPRGDSEMEFTPEDHAAAQAKFDEFLKNGGLAFREDGEQTKAFDPNAAELIMVPQLRGG